MTAPVEDGPSPNEAPSLVGQVISARYKVLEQIGEGGMGAVYLAEHVHMRKRVALKVLHPEMVQQPEVVARFEREAMAAAHIEHPNVAAATDFGRTDDGAFFLVLEYIEGTDLRAVLRRGALEVGRAAHIARQIAAALMRAHELGIVHRDLKPENVMLVDRGAEGEIVKVLDFGIAKVHVETLASANMSGGRTGVPGPILTRAGAVFGTPEYMAPEQALGETVDHRADLYAVGVIMFEMLSGKLPFEGNDTLSLLARQIAENAPMLRAFAPAKDISPELEALVMKLLAKQPRERFANAEELLTALDHLPLSPSEAEARRLAAEARSGGPSSRVLPPSTRGTFTPADAMARTSPGLVSSPDFGASAAAVTAAVGNMGPQPYGVAAASREPRELASERGNGGIAAGAAASALPVVPTDSKRHIWIAVIVALCGGALLVGSFTLISLYRHVKATVSGLNAEAGVFEGLTNSAPPKKVLSQEQLDTAGIQGPAALEKLVVEFPDEPRILRSLYRAHLQRGDGADAMSVITRLLAIQPAAANDVEVVSAVTVAATSTSLDEQDAAIRVLEGPLGARGADILYDLANRSPAIPGKARFAASLNKAEVLSHASPALLVLTDLRAAKKCEDKREILARVREHGDARALTHLKNLQKSRGCGFLGTRDCWACLRKGDELEATIFAIQARL